MFTSHDEKVICLSLDDAPVNMDFSSALSLLNTENQQIKISIINFHNKVS